MWFIRPLSFSVMKHSIMSYAAYGMQERIFNPEWMTFPVDTPEQDAAVLLFDMLYERLTVFTRQYWMGGLAGVQGANGE